MSQVTPSKLAVGSVFHGRYRVVRTIKSGGMGTVYEVLDTTTNSPRALKVMLSSVLEDADQRARFALEAKITGNIDSEHLLRVFDAGVDETSGEPFLVMDLLRGEELQSMLGKRGPLPPEEVLAYLSQLARVLEKTHAAGIVHRDIKPENLFVTRRDDGSPCLKILDFGIAKVVAHQQAQKTRALGTPLYMAPEQIRGESSIGPRTDLYSFAHVAYALLAGEAYWVEDSKAHDSLYPMLMKLLAGATEPPSARAFRRSTSGNPSHGQVRLPPAFDAWFLKATAPDPAARFESATALVSALAAVLRGQAAPASVPLPPGPNSAVAPHGAGPTQPSAYAPVATGPVTGQAHYPYPGQGYGPATAQAPGPGYGPAAAHAPGHPAAFQPHPAAGNAYTGPVTGQGPGWGAVPAPQPAGSTWVTGQAPPPGYAAQPPHKASSPARWIIPLVLGAVAITAILVFGLTRSSGPAPAPAGACGQAAACVVTSLPDPAHVEPLDLLPQAKKLAQGVDKRAQLIGIFVTDSVKDGTVDIASGYGSLMFNFGTPDGALTVLFRPQYTSVMRGPGYGEALPDPRCPMKSAWKAAVAAGAPTGKPMSIMYQPDPPYGGTVWLVSSQSKLYYLDSTTCALKRPAR